MAGIWGNYLCCTYTLGDPKTFCLCPIEARGTQQRMDYQVTQWMFPSLCCLRHVAFSSNFISLHGFKQLFIMFQQLDWYLCLCLYEREIQPLLEHANCCTHLKIHSKCAQLLCVFYPCFAEKPSVCSSFWNYKLVSVCLLSETWFCFIKITLPISSSCGCEASLVPQHSSFRW